MAPTYKLTYFDAKALAEPIRFLLSAGGQEFEDVRIARDKWPEIKNSMPFGKLPVLEFDGYKVTQSLAICRYLAKQFDLVGSSEWDAFQVDIAVDTINDFKNLVGEYFRLVFYGGEKKEIDRKKEQILRETLPFYLPRFEEMVKNNKGHFVNGKLTWVDIYFTAHADSIGVLSADWRKEYPALSKLTDKVLNLPAIKAWVAKRPKTEF